MKDQSSKASGSPLNTSGFPSCLVSTSCWLPAHFRIICEASGSCSPELCDFYLLAIHLRLQLLNGPCCLPKLLQQQLERLRLLMRTFCAHPQNLMSSKRQKDGALSGLDLEGALQRTPPPLLPRPRSWWPPLPLAWAESVPTLTALLCTDCSRIGLSAGTDLRTTRGLWLLLLRLLRSFFPFWGSVAGVCAG